MNFKAAPVEATTKARNPKSVLWWKPGLKAAYFGGWLWIEFLHGQPIITWRKRRLGRRFWQGVAGVLLVALLLALFFLLPAPAAYCAYSSLPWLRCHG